MLAETEEVLAAAKRHLSDEAAAGTATVTAGGRTAQLRVRTALEIRDSTPANPSWVSKPWAVAGGVTEVDGKIKSAGKTTWVLAMVCAVLDGLPFMGSQTINGPVVYLTEQADSSLREALRRAGVLDRHDLHILSWADWRELTWPKIVAAAVDHARAVGAVLLVVDTLPQ